MAGLTWDERLLLAVECGSFTEEDKHLVKDWRTCAVGENAPTTAKKLHMGGLVGSTIDTLGLDFTSHVTYDRVPEAISTYRQIKEEIRARAKRQHRRQ